MKNILITGGCGFIGINLINYLQNSPIFNIIVLDNLSLGKKEYLAGFDVEIVVGDIRDASLVKKVVKGVDGVIHLAADTRVMDSITNPDVNFAVNVTGTYNLLRAAQEAGVEHFVFASTGGAIIGDAIPPVHESMVPRPISPYGASKLCGEAYCSAFAGSYGMKTVALRFSNVYGPYSYHKGSVVAAFFKRILAGQPLIVYGDGSQTRDFVFAKDLCAAIVKSLSLDQGGEAFQLGSGVETSVNELIAAIQQVIHPHDEFRITYEPPRQGEIQRTYSDITKARRYLGFHPEVKLPEGLRATWEWFLARRDSV
jgi:UDP-glucose 4-epimerase